MKIISKCLCCNKELKYYKSNSTGKYCDNKCQQIFQKRKIIERWLLGEYNGSTCEKTCVQLANSIREYLINKSDRRCSECLIILDNPSTKESGLQIHHIDGNALNNKKENLQVLCRNCHWKTPNFGNKNKKSTRRKKKIVYETN